MQLIVNGDQIDFNKENINSLLTDLGISSDGIAVAVNETVVSKTQWSDFHLKENDQILIITATQGG